MKSKWNNILHAFPKIDYGFAYGSAVFIKNSAKNEMADFIFAVNNPNKWHSENIIKNPEHYHFLNKNKKWRDKIQKWGSGIIFFPYITPPPNLPSNIKAIKYGVIGIEHLKKDLIDWKWLYAAGRMHKPIKIIKQNSVIDKHNKQNRLNALLISLILLPSSFSKQKLIETIISLSYKGDVRMGFAECPEKITHISKWFSEEFDKIYGEFLVNYLKTAENSKIDAQKFQKEKVQKIEDKNQKFKKIDDKNHKIKNEAKQNENNVTFENYQSFINNHKLNQNGQYQNSLKNGKNYKNDKNGEKNNKTKNVIKISFKNGVYSIPDQLEISEDAKSHILRRLTVNCPSILKTGQGKILAGNDVKEWIELSINRTVSNSSIIQALKGILTCSPKDSFAYFRRKRNKFLK